MKTIWVLNGPNLNLLGTREPEVYGRDTLGDLEKRIVAHGESRGVTVNCYQSNIEGELVEKIQAARGKANGLILNPASYSHTSIAIRDAIAAVELPAIEVHISNIYKREEFRWTSITAPACVGTISGLGLTGYELALDALIKNFASASEKP